MTADIATRSGRAIAKRRRPPFIYAALLASIGLFLSWGGTELLWLGGSPYYAVTGALVLASAWFLFRGKRLGAWLYGLMLGGTVLWSVWEVGFEPYGLSSRIVAPSVLGLWLLLPWTWRKLS